MGLQCQSLELPGWWGAQPGNPVLVSGFSILQNVPEPFHQPPSVTSAREMLKPRSRGWLCEEGLKQATGARGCWGRGSLRFLGRGNKVPQTGRFRRNGYPPYLEAGSSKSRHRQGWFFEGSEGRTCARPPSGAWRWPSSLCVFPLSSFHMCLSLCPRFPML